MGLVFGYRLFSRRGRVVSSQQINGSVLSADGKVELETFASKSKDRIRQWVFQSIDQGSCLSVLSCIPENQQSMQESGLSRKQVLDIVAVDRLRNVVV